MGRGPRDDDRERLGHARGERFGPAPHGPADGRHGLPGGCVDRFDGQPPASRPVQADLELAPNFPANHVHVIARARGRDEVGSRPAFTLPNPESNLAPIRHPSMIGNGCDTPDSYGARASGAASCSDNHTGPISREAYRPAQSPRSRDRGAGALPLTPRAAATCATICQKPGHARGVILERHVPEVAAIRRPWALLTPFLGRDVIRHAAVTAARRPPAVASDAAVADQPDHGHARAHDDGGTHGDGADLPPVRVGEHAVKHGSNDPPRGRGTGPSAAPACPRRAHFMPTTSRVRV
jgi:hypothetical protein